MKLDERILPGKRPLTCFDTEEARKFEGEEGYFSDYPRAFSYGEVPITKCATKGILKLDKYHENCPYIDETTCLNYPYFLPAEWLKPEEPEIKWRPFKDHAEYKEFLNDGVIEDWVKIKNKTTNEIYELMYVGGGNDKIILGGMIFSVSGLFRDFELFNECAREWQPFGVEGEE